MWLKWLSPGMKLERLSTQFETRGFRSRRSLAYVKTEDLDSFFPSPSKLLLAERRVLEAELSNIREENRRKSSQFEPKRLNFVSGQPPSASDHPASSNEMSQSGNVGLAPAPCQSLQFPLDRRAAELSDNLKVLEVKVESARSHLQGEQKALGELPNAHERRGKVCAVCHTAGHNRAKCQKRPCQDVNFCKLKDKHPELQNNIRTLQRDLKQLELGIH